MEWIKVTEKLPDLDQSEPCLVFDKHHHQIVVRVWNGYYSVWDDEDGDDYYTDAVGGKITHWMPLPKIPIE